MICDTCEKEYDERGYIFPEPEFSGIGKNKFKMLFMEDRIEGYRQIIYENIHMCKKCGGHVHGKMSVVHEPNMVFSRQSESSSGR